MNAQRSSQFSSNSMYSNTNPRVIVGANDDDDLGDGFGRGTGNYYSVVAAAGDTKINNFDLRCPRIKNDIRGIDIFMNYIRPMNFTKDASNLGSDR